MISPNQKEELAKKNDARNARRRLLAEKKRNDKREIPLQKDVVEIVEQIEEAFSEEKSKENTGTVKSNISRIHEGVVNISALSHRRVIIKRQLQDGTYTVAMWTKSGLRNMMYCEIEEYADAAIVGFQNLAVKLYKCTYSGGTDGSQIFSRFAADSRHDCGFFF